jgi:hypothetical protein
MEKLAVEYQDKGFEFVFVYTREAHPGEIRPHHVSFEQKLAQARAFQKEYDIQRPILVDDLDGEAHRAYGALPDTLKFILDYQIRRLELRQANRKVGPNYCELLGFRPRQWDRFVAHLQTNGPRAVADWEAAMEYWKTHPPRHG